MLQVILLGASYNIFNTGFVCDTCFKLKPLNWLGEGEKEIQKQSPLPQQLLLTSPSVRYFICRGFIKAAQLLAVKDSGCTDHLPAVS